jgi:GNAT superfamily N-acetyltransferase
MNERFITSLCHVNYGESEATKIVVRDTTINEIMCSLVIEASSDEPGSNVWLWDLNTRRQYRRKGFARMAVEYAVKLFSNVDITLIAKPSVRFTDDIPLYILVKFYESCGFEVAEKLSDRVIMKRYATNEIQSK